MIVMALEKENRRCLNYFIILNYFIDGKIKFSNGLLATLYPTSQKGKEVTRKE